MKVVRFIYPMFLTALGLHAALLFVPLGGKSESALLEEDVPLSELTDKSVQALQDSVVDSSLPDSSVPARVSAGTGVRSGAIAQSPPTAAIVPQPAPQPTRRIVASSPSRIIPKPVSNSSNTSASSPPSAALPDLTADDSTSPMTSGSSLPDLTARNNASENSASESSSAESISPETNEQSTSENVSVANTPLLARLLDSAKAVVVPASLTSSLTDLSESLTYRAKGTDEESAKQALDAWRATIGKQANAARLERVEPILNSDVVLDYPIESAKSFRGNSSEGVALPSLSVCLEKEPHAAEVGLVFDSQGELVGQPELIRSTGYEALNQEIMVRLVQPDGFLENRESKAYLYDVTVDYDQESCVSLESLKK